MQCIRRSMKGSMVTDSLTQMGYIGVGRRGRRLSVPEEVLVQMSKMTGAGCDGSSCP
jgi:hypothetical protein